MKKAALAAAFIGLFSFFSLFGEDEAANKDGGMVQNSGVVKFPIEW